MTIDICRQMRLWEFPDQVVFEPLEGGSEKILSFKNGKPQLIDEVPLPNDGCTIRTTKLYGVLGGITLLAGTYLLAITGRQHVGSYRGSPVFRVSSMKFIPCGCTSGNLSSQEKRDEDIYLKMLKVMEKTPGLYFSYAVDLTLNSQRSHDTAEMRKKQALWEQADRKFLWNNYLLEMFIDFKLEEYILPVIQGSFQTMQGLMKDKFISITLIARRSVSRIGTRMWRRGADLSGSAANFVETEQIIELPGSLASYVQVRGSIPVLWEQIVDLKYKPKLKPISHEELPKIVRSHFSDLSQRYGSVLAVDLINQHGSEGVLSAAFKTVMEQLQSKQIRYVPFDFHRICGHIHFELLSSLHDQIADDLTQQKYFLVNSTGEVIEKQMGVVRVNCIDCLDRTNVTQSLFARRALESQLKRIGFFKSTERIDQYSLIEEQYKCLWANHGDEISIQYSGTSALKGDFVRYGRRSISGLIQDGINSLQRYYLNNFYDGFKQDAMDLVAGNYTVSRSKPSPFQTNVSDTVMSLPLVSAIVMLMLYFSMTFFSQANEDWLRALYSLLFAIVIAIVIAGVRTNGRKFCSQPRLCKLI